MRARPTFRIQHNPSRSLTTSSSAAIVVISAIVAFVDFSAFFAIVPDPVIDVQGSAVFVAQGSFVAPSAFFSSHSTEVFGCVAPAFPCAPAALPNIARIPSRTVFSSVFRRLNRSWNRKDFGAFPSPKSSTAASVSGTSIPSARRSLSASYTQRSAIFSDETKRRADRGRSSATASLMSY